MRTTHTTPDVMKTKLKADFATLNDLKTRVNQTEQAIQDYIGAYVLGAKLPTVDLKFDENFDLTYEVAVEGEDLGEDPNAEQTAEMEVLKSPSKKKVR